MAIKHLTYKDIPQRKREKAAARAAADLKASLNNSVTESERAKHLARLENIKKWAIGELPVIDPKGEAGKTAKPEKGEAEKTAKPEKGEAGKTAKPKKRKAGKTAKPKKGRAHKVGVSERLSVKEN